MPGRPKPRQTDEVNLFPAIRQGGRPGLAQPIAAIRTDHDDHAAEVARIRALTGGLTLPEGACRKWTALYESLDRFFADLEEHMRLENDALFLQVERRAWRPEQREVPERR